VVLFLEFEKYSALIPINGFLDPMSFLLTGPKAKFESSRYILHKTTLCQVSSKTSLFDGQTQKSTPTSPEKQFNHSHCAIKFNNFTLAFWVDRIVTSDSEENKSYESLDDFYGTCNKVKKKNSFLPISCTIFTRNNNI